MPCIHCHSASQEIIDRETYQYRGQPLTVDHQRFHECLSCGEQWCDATQDEANAHRIREAKRTFDQQRESH